MNKKKFIACVYLYKEKAVESLNDVTVIDEDPVALAKYYSDNNVDELIVFDMSNGDAEHEKAIDMIKQICKTVEIDVYGAGNVHRMEDIKKLLYAGCKKAVLDYHNPENIAITEEVSLKFGKEKIMVAYEDASVIYENKNLVEQYASELIALSTNGIMNIEFACKLPVLLEAESLQNSSIIDYFHPELVCGITGNAVNKKATEIMTLKKLCKDVGYSTDTFEAAYKWSDFKLNSDGLLPVVVQDYITSEVLMVAYMNETAYLKTLQIGKMTYYSRSRQELWLKGDTSGHYQYVKSLHADCDMDTLLAKVSQVGAACHTGAYSCFFNEVAKKEYVEPSNPIKVFEDVFAVIQDRKVNPKEGSYTNYLFDKGVDKILKKLGEEATEIVIAAKNPNPNEIKYEISDFLYHMMVLMAEKNITWEEITEELSNR